MHEKTRQKVLGIIRNEIQFDPDQIDPDEDLRQQVLLDSMQFVALAARIETEFNIELPITIMEVSTLNQFLEVVGQTMWEGERQQTVDSEPNVANGHKIG